MTDSEVPQGNQDGASALPEPIPQWVTKPCLIWVGKCLGADLYADVQHIDKRKRDMIEKVLATKLTTKATPEVTT